MCIGSPKPWANARPRVTKLGAGAKTGAVKVEEPILFDSILSALLDDMILTSLFGSLSFDKPTDFGDADLGADQYRRFFRDAIVRKAKLFN